MFFIFIFIIVTSLYPHNNFSSSALSGEYRTDLRTCSQDTKNAHLYTIHPYTTDMHGNWLCRAYKAGQGCSSRISLTVCSVQRIEELERRGQATVHRNKKTQFVESVSVFLTSCDPSPEELGQKIDVIMQRMYANLN